MLLLFVICSIMDISKAYEFLDRVWLSSKARNNAVLRNIKFMEKFMLWIVDTIVSQRSVDQRALMLSQIIKVAKVDLLNEYP